MRRAIHDASDQTGPTGYADLAAFVDSNFDTLLRSAVLLAGPDDAEDLVQEALIRLNHHWERVSRMSNPEGYAYRVLVNRFLSARRRWRPSTTSRSTETVARLTPDAEDPSLSRVVDLDQLRRALDILPRRQRTAIVLRHYLDHDTHHVAELMRVRESTVRSLIARGLDTLRQQLGNNEGAPNDHIPARP